MSEEIKKDTADRCKSCEHLISLHNDSGCGTWLLGVRAVPLYLCACVRTVSSFPKFYNSEK